MILVKRTVNSNVACYDQPYFMRIGGLKVVIRSVRINGVGLLGLDAEIENI